MSTTTVPPPLPPRTLSHHHQRPQQPSSSLPTPAITQHQPPDEPPPAYTPAPEHHTYLLQVGPPYPYAPSSTHPSNPTLPHQANYHHPYPQPQAELTQPHHHPNNTSQASAVSNPSNLNPFPGLSEPTTVPTPGRPLLYEDRILVYPHVNGTAYFCPKCCNTGFKGFDPYRPCRKCWIKYGKPWQVVRLSPMTSSSPGTLQRPLPPTEVVVNPPPLVVQPGDPRIGGRLCLNCNGSGQKLEELTVFNVFLGGAAQEVCPSCRGTGRIFL